MHFDDDELFAHKEQGMQLKMFSEKLIAPSDASSYDVLKIVDGIVAGESNGEVVLVQIDTGRCYGLNRVASTIWSQLNQPMQKKQLVEKILKASRNAPPQAELEIVNFIDQLQQQGLIEVVQ